MAENEYNNFVEKTYYNYIAKNFLVKDPSLFIDTNEYRNIMLCLYSINSEGKYPFLQYLLAKNNLDVLSLPTLPIYNSFNKENLVSYSKVFLSGILLVDNFELFNNEIEFNGFYEFDKNLYLFFDMTNCKLNFDDTYSSCPIRYVLIDEIINHKNICNIKISDDTTNFFLRNESISYLYDQNNEAYEIPIVGYVGKSTQEKLNFVLTFGESSKNKSAIMGPYYYFTDFYNAIRQGGWSYNYTPEYLYDKLITDDENGRYLKGGIVRFALFTGNVKYIENMPNDPIDESDIKKERLNDISLNNKLEVLTLRISDHDGLWSKKYDSVYLSKIELDDGSIFEETPMLVLKEYNQQIPLSHHYINKKNLGKRFESDKYTYNIV